jgi:hypothetical protein
MMSADYLRAHQARKAAATLAALVAVASACGDGDGGGKAGKEKEPERESGRRGAFSGADVIKSQQPIHEHALSNWKEYLGVIQGSDIYIAIHTFTDEEGEKALVYLCDGQNTAELFGGIGGRKLDLKSKDGSAVTATVEDDAVSGTLTLNDGRSLEFKAEADASDTAGLWFSNTNVDDAFAGEDWGGWIVLPDGSQRGNLRLAGVVMPAGQLDSTTSIVGADSGSILTGQLDQFRCRIFF